MAKFQSFVLFLALVAISTGSHLRSSHNPQQNEEVIHDEMDVADMSTSRELWGRWGRWYWSPPRRPRPPPPPPPLPILRDIVATAQSTPSLSILVELVVAADLVETLQGDGPFTVFAPTNTAFDNALVALGLTLDELKASPDLASILTYHVLPGRLQTFGNDFRGGGPFTTVNGATVDTGRYRAPNVFGGIVKKVNDATMITSDISTSNGVVHVIDQVLLPPVALPVPPP